MKHLLLNRMQNVVNNRSCNNERVNKSAFHVFFKVSLVRQICNTVLHSVAQITEIFRCPCRSIFLIIISAEQLTAIFGKEKPFKCLPLPPLNITPDQFSNNLKRQFLWNID